MAQGDVHKLGVPGSDVEECGVRQKSRFLSTSWKRPLPPLPWLLPTQPQSSPLPMDSPSPCRLSLLSLGFLFPIPIHYWANYCLSFKALLKCPLLPGASKSPWVWAGMRLQLCPLPLSCPGQLLEARTLPVLVTFP